MKIPDKIKLALARYFHGRRQVNEWKAREGLQRIKWLLGEGMVLASKDNPCPVWDKQAAFTHVEKACADAGWCVSAVAGSFSLNRRGKGQRWIICDESNYLNDGVIVKKEKPQVATHAQVSERI